MIIQPRTNFIGTYHLPGDKSITHRAVMFNAISGGEAVVTNAQLSADCLATADCMRRLGAEIEIRGSRLRVVGTRAFPGVRPELYAANSGTSMRLLTGLVAGCGGEAVITGDGSLSARPMDRVAAPLAAMGAKIGLTDGHAPVTVERSALRGIDYEMPVASAQVKSAILLAGLGAEGVTSVIEKIRSRDHSERLLAAMGAEIAVDGLRVSVRRSRLEPVSIDVPADISGCAYFLALGALLGRVTCRKVGVNPTRTGILDAMRRMGAKIEIFNEHMSGSEPVADIRVHRSDLVAVDLTEEEMPSLIDEIPVIAVLAAYARGTTTIRGAGELRVKESDRIKTTVAMIRAMGGIAEELPDGMAIEGKEWLPGGAVTSYGDHRIAMSGAVGLTASRQGGNIVGAECVAISFPDFFRRLGAEG